MSDASSAASRRAFLKALGLGATSAVTAPSPAAGLAAPPAPVTPAATLLADVEVRGLSYRATPEVLARIVNAAALVLRREAGNGYDPNAISIHLATGEHIGYVPRESNEMLAALLDAGHELRGEITAVERNDFETRLSGDQKPFPGRIILEELAADQDGARRVRMAEVRPRFRAWLATGLAPDERPPDPLDVPGWPGWKKLVAEHESRDLLGQSILRNAALIQPGLELELVDGLTTTGLDGFFLNLPGGEMLGHLRQQGDLVRAAISMGLEVKAVVTRVKRDATAPKDSFGWPWIEIRSLGLPPVPTEAQIAGWQAERQKRADERFQRSVDRMIEENKALDAKVRHAKAVVAKADEALRNLPTPPVPPPPTPIAIPPKIESPPRMTDIRLFRTTQDGVSEIGGTTDTIERSLQTTFEKNLETLLGVRFLATEFAFEGGRIDTLGLDENDAPVILEFKRASNENVINQGLFYLDWLVTHRKDFQWLVLEKLGKEAAERVDWTGPRLICVAGDFSRYDAHAIKQITRHIELIRYRRYGEDLLMLEKVASTAGAASMRPATDAPGGGAPDALRPAPAQRYKLISQTLDELDPALRDRWEALRAHLLALGDDVEEVVTNFYVAFKRIKNFACVEFRPRAGKILVFVKVDPTGMELPAGFLRDVSQIGHFGTGDLEITLSNAEDLARAAPLIARSYAAV